MIDFPESNTNRHHRALPGDLSQHVLMQIAGTAAGHDELRDKGENYGPYYTDRTNGNLLPTTDRSASTSRRKRNNFAGRPPVSVAISPVSSTRSC